MSKTKKIPSKTAPAPEKMMPVYSTLEATPYAKIAAEARAGERPIAAQVRMILRQHADNLEVLP